MKKEVQIGNMTIELESKIIQVLWRDNTRGNTFHFVWIHDKPAGTYFLELVTHNTRNGQNFLLKRVAAGSKAECLREVLKYVEETHKEEHNWTVFWIDENGEDHQSYFCGVDEEEVKVKFFYEENTKATIEQIKKSSIA